MNKILKELNFTCPECLSIYQLLEIHQKKPGCCESCLSQWKALLHQHFQEQIILHLAQQEAKKDQNNHDNQ